VHLPGLAVPGQDAAGNLPQGHRLALARAVGDLQGDRRLSQLIVMPPTAVVGAGELGERFGGQVSHRAFAVGQDVEPGVEDVGEQGEGPAAPVKAHRDPPAFTHDRAQLGEQAAQLTGQRLRWLGDHHRHRVTLLIGDPRLHGRRGGELHPRDMGLLHIPRPVVGAGVPVGIQEPEGLRPGGGVMAGQRHHQLRCLAGGGELGELAADRFHLRGGLIPLPARCTSRARRRPWSRITPLRRKCSRSRAQELVRLGLITSRHHSLPPTGCRCKSLRGADPRHRSRTRASRGRVGFGRGRRQ
jgi:hypothetical protein